MSENAKTLKRQADAIIPEVWAMSLNKKLDKSGVGMKIVNKIYENEVKDFGDTVNIGELGDVTVSDYSEDETEGGIKYQRGIFISDITKKQTNIEDLQSKFSARAKTAIDLAKDTFVLNAFSEIPAENKPEADVEFTPESAYKCMVWLAKTLKNNNAIQIKNDKVFKSNQAAGEALPYVVINPDVEAVLLQSPEFIHASQAGDRVLREGSIGTIAGLDVLVCTNLPTAESKVNIMAGINEAIAYAGNISKIEELRDDKFFGTNVRGLYVYGKKVVLPKALAGMTVSIKKSDTLPTVSE